MGREMAIILLCLIFVFCLAASWYFRRYIKIGQRVLRQKPIGQYYKEEREKESYVKLGEISSSIKVIIVALEDSGFWAHHGIDIRKILHASWVNFWTGKRLLGGSTITQQLAKNMYFTHKRILGRKIAEIYVAKKLESQLSKEQILELYLNIINFGNNKFGIKNACQFDLGLVPADATVNHAITLGSIMPAPNLYHPLKENGLFEKSKAIALQKLRDAELLEGPDVEKFQQSGYKDALPGSVSVDYEQRCKELWGEINKP